MTCERVRLSDGTVVTICSRGVRARRCACGSVAEYLCDAPRGPRSARTCDAPLCDQCRVVVASERDFCRAHAAVEAVRVAVPTMLRATTPVLQLDLFNDRNDRSSR